jgi:hypothetical protein
MMGLLRETPVASEEARRLILPGGCGVWKKRSAIIACMVRRTTDALARSLQLPKNMIAPAVDERNGDG